MKKAGDPSKVMPLMIKLDQYIKGHEIKDADRVADEILDLIRQEQ